VLARAPISVSAAARRVIRDGALDPAQRYELWQQVGSPAQLSNLLTFVPPLLTPLLSQEDGIDGEAHPLDQFLYLESQTRMIDFINFEVDRMSMASSVEARFSNPNAAWLHRTPLGGAPNICQHGLRHVYIHRRWLKPAISFRRKSLGCATGIDPARPMSPGC
jgi:hypothetical protein